MNRALRPPCGKDCPRRRAQPNCHNRDYCPAWGEFQDAEAVRKEAKKKEADREADVNIFIKTSYRRLKNRARKKD